MIHFVVDDVTAVVSKHLSSERISEISKQLDSFCNPFIDLQAEQIQNRFY